MIVTSLGLPYEIYDLANKVTVLRVVAFVINLGLVLYLVLTKRLFGVRGGKKAYEARLRSESILDAEMAALAAEQEVAVEREVAAEGAAPGPPRTVPGIPGRRETALAGRGNPGRRRAALARCRNPGRRGTALAGRGNPGRRRAGLAERGIPGRRGAALAERGKPGHGAGVR